MSGREFVLGAYPVADFLEDLPEPPVGSCSEVGFVTSNTTRELNEGVYCGGLTITGGQDVTLNPGTYVIKGGPLLIDASMHGKLVKADDVLIYLADQQAELQVIAGRLAVRAKRTGHWAGVAIMSAREDDAPNLHRISNFRVHISGIFYAPDSRVELSADYFNTICRHLCFVSDTLKVTKTRINSSPAVASWPSPFGGLGEMPAEPPTLKRNMRPYLAGKERFGFY